MQVSHAVLYSLGVAYAGTGREDIVELLAPIITDTGLSMELSAMAALAAAFVQVGTCHGDLTSSILQTMMERDEAQLKDKHGVFMALALGLLYMSTCFYMYRCCEFFRWSMNRLIGRQTRRRGCDAGDAQGHRVATEQAGRGAGGRVRIRDHR